MICTETCALGLSGERPLDSYFARPKAGKRPGLIIFTEMWGITDSKRRMADEYARNDWCALVPNIFWRSGCSGVLTFEQADKATERMQALDFDKATEDVITAAQWLRSNPYCSGTIGALGFCIGGRFAFLAAARAGIDAAVALYAFGLAQYPAELANMNCPLQLHYGLQDRHIPAAEISAVTRAAEHNSNVEIYLYPNSGHGFFSPERPTFDPDATEAATRRIESFLAQLM